MRPAASGRDDAPRGVTHRRRPPVRSARRAGILTDEIGTTYETPPTMMHTDPPQHTRYRRLVQPGFKPSMVRLMEAGVTAKALALLDQIQGGVAFDVVQDLPSRSRAGDL